MCTMWFKKKSGLVKEEIKESGSSSSLWDTFTQSCYMCCNIYVLKRFYDHLIPFNTRAESACPTDWVGTDEGFSDHTPVQRERLVGEHYRSFCKWGKGRTNKRRAISLKLTYDTMTMKGHTAKNEVNQCEDFWLNIVIIAMMKVLFPLVQHCPSLLPALRLFAFLPTSFSHNFLIIFLSVGCHSLHFFIALFLTPTLL